MNTKLDELAPGLAQTFTRWLLLKNCSARLAGFALAISLSATQPANGASFRSTGAMAIARDSHTATLLPDAQVLVAGGYDDDGVNLSSSEIYNPVTGTWSATGPMVIARRGHTASLLPGGAVLVAGGWDDDVGSLSSAELYNPVTGVWTATAPISVARSAHTATLLPDGSVLVTGGVASAGTALASAEIYDPASGVWTDAGSMNAGRNAHTATLLANGRVLVAGGYPVSSKDSTELFDPATRSWTVSGHMAEGRVYHMATLLSDGKVLLAGGYPPIAVAELYGPGTGNCALASPMKTALDSHTASLLLNGKVLVTGGETSVLNPYREVVISGAELYDPASDTWSLAGLMATNREWHTATMLTNGQVLIAGGYTGRSDLSSAELYTNSTAPIDTLATVTVPASAISPTSATLRGSVFPNHQPTGAWFEYGTTTSYGSATLVIPIDASNGFPVAVSSQVSGLSLGTLYHFRLVATNGAGTSSGADLTFTAHEAPLIENGGFETGDFTGWYQSGFWLGEFVDTDPLGRHSGTYGAVLGTLDTPGYLFQQIPTNPGWLYLISFWLERPYDEPPNEFSVTWDGTNIFYGVNLVEVGWTNIQLRAVATRSGTILKFGFLDDPSYFGFDDVSVVPIPPPEFLPGAPSVINGNLALRWTSLAGQVYQPQYTTSLNPPAWNDLGNRITAIDSTTTAFDSIGSDPQRFYRVVLVP